MTSPAEISNASPGSMVMMSSMAQVTTSVSLGVAASTAAGSANAVATANAAADRINSAFKRLSLTMKIAST